MQKSESIGKLAEALAKAQADFGPLVKGASNPFFKSKYSDLAAVVDVARMPLAENGLAYVQTTDDCEDGKLMVETTLLHTSGEWITSRLAMPIPKADPQGYGSAFTYARRYALQAILGLAAEDDDAESAMQRKDTPKDTLKVSAEKQDKPSRQDKAPTKPPGDVSPVSEFEADTLEALAKQYKANTKVLLETYGVDSFRKFTKAQLLDATNKLKAKYGEKAA